MAAENERLAELLSKRESNEKDFDKGEESVEFFALMRKYGFRTADDQCCTCNNGYMCNPANPPPGCGACTCVQCP